MVHDMNTLKRVRWRYDKLLHPSEIMDQKMREILLIPPAREPKDTIKIEEITHEVNTRARSQAEERRKAEDDQRKERQRREEEKTNSTQRYIEETEELEQINDAELQKVTRGLYIFIEFESGQRQLELEMTDVKALLDKKSLISDTIMYISQT